MKLAPILGIIGLLLFVVSAFHPTSDVNLKTYGVMGGVLLLFLGFLMNKVSEARRGY